MHALLTIFLGGMWLPVWALAAFYPGAYRCSACGAKYAKPRRPWSPAFVLFGILVIGLIIVGLFRGFSGNESVRAPAALPANPAQQVAAFPTTITASALRQAFRDTPMTAETRYADAELTVNGDAKLEPDEKDGASWLVFLGGDGEVLAKCAVADTELAALQGHFGDTDKKAVTIRCRLKQFAPDGTVTLHHPTLVK